MTTSAAIRTTVPAQLDRLNRTQFHTRIVAAFGVAWVLDDLHGKSNSVAGGLPTLGISAWPDIGSNTCVGIVQ